MRAGKNTTNARVSRSDDYRSPREAFDLLFNYVPRDKLVWAPFYFDGVLNMPDDIKYIHSNNDFFLYEPDNFEILIDNPPYSVKQKVFDRCEQFGKPYALLVPFDTLERQYMADIMKTKDVTIIIPKKRYKFNEMSFTPAFKTIWICVGFNLGREIIHE